MYVRKQPSKSLCTVIMVQNRSTIHTEKVYFHLEVSSVSLENPTLFGINLCDVHVFDGAAECVCDRPVVDGLFAQTEVRQLHVS